MKLLILIFSCLYSFKTYTQVLTVKDLISLSENNERYFMDFAKNRGYKFHKKDSSETDYYYGASVQHIVYGLARYSDNRILYMTLKLQDFQELQKQLKSLDFTFQEVNVEDGGGKLFTNTKVYLLLKSSYEDDKGKKKKLYLINVFK